MSSTSGSTSASEEAISSEARSDEEDIPSLPLQQSSAYQEFEELLQLAKCGLSGRIMVEPVSVNHKYYELSEIRKHLDKTNGFCPLGFSFNSASLKNFTGSNASIKAICQIARGQKLRKAHSNSGNHDNQTYNQSPPFESSLLRKSMAAGFGLNPDG